MTAASGTAFPSTWTRSSTVSRSASTSRTRAGPMTAAAIEVEDLHKSYGDFEALRGVSLKVDPGEVVAVLGPNGAGKTTLVEILEGYRTRDAGRVSVLGQDPASGGSDLRQRIGIVLQQCGIEGYL